MNSILASARRLGLFLTAVTVAVAALSCAVAHSPAIRPVDVVAAVVVSTPKPGFVGNPFDHISSIPVFRIPERPEDFTTSSIQYRLTVSDTGRISVAAWVDGVPSQVAVVGPNAAISAPDPDKTNGERDKDAAIVLRQTDDMALPLISFDFGHLSLAVAGITPTEGTRIVDRPFGCKGIQSWKRTPTGWDYDVGELELWHASPGQPRPAEGLRYIKDNQLSVATDPDAKPFYYMWSERQTWPSNGHWWSDVARRRGTASGAVIVRMHTDPSRRE